MSKVSVTKKFHFDSAHRLPNYSGQCANLHGHRWFLEVEVSGDVRKDTGMIIDFGNIKSIVQNAIIDKLDHHYLNDVYANPTAECMVMHIADELAPEFAALTGTTLDRVRLYETPEAYAEWKL